jgi:hypothetical protein
MFCTFYSTPKFGMHACLRTCVLACLPACVLARVRAHACMHACMCASARAFVARVRASTHTRTYACSTVIATTESPESIVVLLI